MKSQQQWFFDKHYGATETNGTHLFSTKLQQKSHFVFYSEGKQPFPLKSGVIAGAVSVKIVYLLHCKSLELDSDGNRNA